MKAQRYTNVYSLASWRACAYEDFTGKRNGFDLPPRPMTARQVATHVRRAAKLNPPVRVEVAIEPPIEVRR